MGPQKNTYVRVSLPAVCIVWQIAMIILFGIFIRYDKESDAHWSEYKKQENLTDLDNDFYFRYPSKYQRSSPNPCQKMSFFSFNFMQSQNNLI